MTTVLNIIRILISKKKYLRILITPYVRSNMKCRKEIQFLLVDGVVLMAQLTVKHFIIYSCLLIIIVTKSFPKDMKKGW